ncbi:MAG TPA: hypothetical protein VFH31_13395 [Pyrinomonadaceae bacterium]|nr:hypothetical protein [Pyrinomonadaceae bacterium]
MGHIEGLEGESVPDSFLQEASQSWLQFSSSIIVKQGILVDQLLATKGLYIQAARDGDRFVKNPDAPKVLVEIPDTGFRKVWDHIFHQHIVDHMKSRGLPRRDAKRAASQYLEEWQKFGQLRMRRTENLPE